MIQMNNRMSCRLRMLRVAKMRMFLQFCAVRNTQCQDSTRLKPDESDLHSLDPGIPGSMLNAPSTSVSHLVPGRVAAAPTLELVAGTASESVPSDFAIPQPLSINSLDARSNSKSVASQTENEDQLLQESFKPGC